MCSQNHTVHVFHQVTWANQPAVTSKIQIVYTMEDSEINQQQRGLFQKSEFCLHEIICMGHKLGVKYN
jgi:hypothetical protein